MSATLTTAVAQLERMYGLPEPPIAEPFALVIWENCAYLVDDERRRSVFHELRRKTALAPDALLRLPRGALVKIIEPGGMHPQQRADKIRTCAETALEIGLDRLREAIRTTPQEARRMLRKFPGIGDPGADKILLFAHTQRTLAPDSNGLRVLLRLGFGTESKDYSRSYRSAAAAVRDQLPEDYPWLVRAHQLLQRHGRELCKRSGPLCEACTLSGGCAWYQATRRP